MQVGVFTIFLVSNVFILGPVFAQDVMPEVTGLDFEDPVADLEKNLAAGDERPVAIGQDPYQCPGLPEDQCPNNDSKNLRVINGTVSHTVEYFGTNPIDPETDGKWDVPADEESNKLNFKANTYARRYNSLLLEKLPEKLFELAPKEKYEQIIAVFFVSDVQSAGENLRIQGRGGALVDGEKAAYFWGSTTPPELDIRITDSRDRLESCRNLADQKIPAGTFLYLKGEGFFRGVERSSGLTGVFQLNSMTNCEVREQGSL